MPKRYSHVRRQRRRDPEWPAVRGQRRVNREKQQEQRRIDRQHQQEEQQRDDVNRSINRKKLEKLKRAVMRTPEYTTAQQLKPTGQAYVDNEDVEKAVKAESNDFVANAYDFKSEFDDDEQQDWFEGERELSAMRGEAKGKARRWAGTRETLEMFETGRRMLAKKRRLPETRKELLKMGKEMLELGTEELRKRGEKMITKGQDILDSIKKIE